MQKVKLLSMLLTLALCAGAEPRLGPKRKLFNGRNLDGFYTFLREQGRDKDPNGVFRVEKGAVRVSGTEYGYFSTKEDFENYHLLVEFQWGEKTHAPREGKARDSGVLFHTSGEDKVWPRSNEFQMIEGGTGDIILVAGATVEKAAGEQWGKNRWKRLGKGEWKDVAGYRDPGRELEKPFGEWNRLELWAEDGRFRYLVNGVLANEASGASDRRGRIVFQSEGAELVFRKIELRPILGR